MKKRQTTAKLILIAQPTIPLTGLLKYDKISANPLEQTLEIRPNFPCIIYCAISLTSGE